MPCSETANSSSLRCPKKPSAAGTARDIGRRGGRLLRVAKDVLVEHAEDRGLLDDLAIVAAVQPADDAANDTGVIDQRSQIGPGALLAAREAEDRLFEAGRDQIILERAFILEVLLGFSAVDLVERRLRDEEVAALDQLRHLPIEERQQQRADMGAVDVGV